MLPESRLTTISEDILSLIFSGMILRGCEVSKSLRDKMFKAGSNDEPVVMCLDLRGRAATQGSNQTLNRHLSFLQNFDHVTVQVTTDCVGLYFTETIIRISKLGKIAHKIKVRGNWMHASDNVHHLAQGLQFLPTLRCLDLSGNGLGLTNGGVAQLTEALKHLKCLSALHLRDNYLGSEGASQVSAGVQFLSCLTILDIDNNKIGSVGVQHIMRGLRSSTCLTHLNFRENLVCPDGAIHLTVLECLSTLDFSKNQLQDLGIDRMFLARQSFSKIISLILRDNHIGSSGAENLAKILAEVKLLVNLDVAWNELRRAGAIFIANSLVSCFHLEFLNIEGNRIGRCGAEQLSFQLRHLHSMKHLNFSHNGIYGTAEVAVRR